VFKKHCIVVALGIARDGKKHVLGLREGSTENSRMVTDLLTDLVDRGVSSEQPTLFVIDGAKALCKAIGDVFGDDYAVVQRCQVHKLRNVLDYLSDEMQLSVERSMKQAWNAGSAELAERQLRRLASSLEREYPSAAASLREGLEETLTLQRLGVKGSLLKTLRTTNPIENLNGSIASYTRNVKRWRGGGSMIRRWVASALCEAERRFRRVRGYREMPALINALDRLSKTDLENAKVA
jgi:transposase-like protein